MWFVVALVAAVAAMLAAHRWRRHLTDALLAPLIGAFLGGSIVGIVTLVVQIVPWETPRAFLPGLLLLAFVLSVTALPLWILAYVPFRGMAPTPADEEGIDPEVVDPWLAAGCTDPRPMRFRPGGKRVWYTLAGPDPTSRLFLISFEGRWMPLVVSGAGDGTLVTTDSSLWMLDGREIRQLTHTADPAKVLKLHADAAASLTEIGVSTTGQTLSTDALGAAAARYRRILLRRPWRVVTSMFRPPLHLGPLRSRRSRRWQLRAFRIEA